MPQDNSDSNERTQASFESDDSLSSTQFQPDQIVGGRYRVLSLLGKGGMGVVYRVEQVFLGKELALKTIDKGLLSDKTVRRFQHEARAAFAVNHPNIISVHDFGLLDDETPFLAMEIVTGETLAERLKRTGALPLAEAIPMFVQICFALAHAHSQGVVHRDIKPSNIMLLENVSEDSGEIVKLLDFGIAKFTHSEESNVQELTKTGEVFGSPLYMSPEQCAGTRVDHRADVYSLGCVMFETLAGTPPFVGENALSTIIMHQTEEPLTLKQATLGEEFPEELERIIQTMLAKNPDDRFQNLGRVAHNLAAVIRGDPLKLSARAPAALREDPNAKTKTITIQRRVFYGLLVAVAALSALLTASVLHLSRTPRDNQTSPRVTQASLNADKTVARSQAPPLSDLDDMFVPFIKERKSRFKAQYANDVSLSRLRGYTEAQIVELNDSEVTDKGIESLKDSKILRLVLSNSKLVKSVDNISRLSYLQQLDLARTNVKDAELPKLAQLKMLTHLDLRDCPVTQKGVQALAASKSLVFVWLSNDILKPPFLATLKDKMPGCSFPPSDQKSKLQLMEANRNGKSEFDLYANCYETAHRVDPLSSVCAQYRQRMAAALANQRRVAEARRLWQESTKILEKNGNLKLLAEALHREADFARIFGELKLAVELADRAKKLYLETSYLDRPEILSTLDTLSGFPGAAGDHARVVEYCQEALDLMKRFPKGNEQNLTLFRERKGWFLYLQGKKAEAITCFRQNLDYFENPTRFSRTEVARANIEIGHCLTDPKLRLKHYDKGIKMVEDLNFDFPQTMPLREHYCDACFSAAQICEADADYEKALNYVKRAISVTQGTKQQDRLTAYRAYEDNLSKLARKKFEIKRSTN